MTDNRLAVLCKALYDYLTEDGIPGCACSVVREQLYAWMMHEPAPEVTEATETRCRRCNAVCEALQSVLTPDALLELVERSTQADPLALALTSLLPNPPSRRLQ